MNDIIGAVTRPRYAACRHQRAAAICVWQMLLRNARSFPAELESYAAYQFDVDVSRSFMLPTLFLLGSYSPPFNSIVTEQLQAVLPHHKTVLLEGQEHGP